MKWLKDRAWLMGIGVVAAFTASVFMYRSGRDSDTAGIWTGLALFFLAIAIPLVLKFLMPGPDED